MGEITFTIKHLDDGCEKNKEKGQSQNFQINESHFQESESDEEVSFSFKQDV